MLPQLTSLRSVRTYDDVAIKVLEDNFNTISDTFRHVTPIVKNFVDATVANIIVVLPSGWLVEADHYYIKTDGSANTVTITGLAGELIEGGTITLSTQYSKVFLTFNKGTWYRISP